MKVDNYNAMENEDPRPDILQKVTGKAKYAADQYPKDIIYAKYVRFPYGSGSFANANVEAARKVSGVLSVEIYDDTECQYAGHRIGEIVAESEDAIGDAEAALDIEFDVSDPKTEIDKLYQGVPEVNAEDVQKLQRLYDLGASVIEATYKTQIQTHSCLETHGASVDHKGDSVEAWVSTQAVIGCEEQMANATGLPASKVTIHSEYVGGGFGSKFSIGPEGRLAQKASKKFGRPCRLLLNRRDEHFDGGNRPGTIQYMKIAADKNGKMLGGRIHCTNVVGYTGGRGACRNPNYYDFGEIVRTENEIALNAGLPTAFRAPGFPPGTFAIESMLDELAASLKMDPVEFRKVNETSDRRVRQLEWGAELIGWKDRKPDGSRPGIVKTGYGCGGASWGNSQGKCECVTDVFRSGELEVRVGIQDIGTGASTLPIDVTAYHLGLPREWIAGKVGNSNYPPGPASGGSVTSRFAAPAIRDSAENAMKKIRRYVAREMGINEEDVVYKEGVFTNPDSGEEVGWKDACSLMSSEKTTAHGEFNPAYYGNGSSDCVQFARVDVDTETGIVRVRKVVAIQACGKPINRLTAENQIYGGVIQGVSFALFEDRRLDGPTGGMVNADLLGYKIAGPVDVPEIVPVLDVIEEDDGVRSIGEPTTIPTAGAIANAVTNAIGSRVRELPITPQRVLAALEKGGAA